MWMKYRRKYSSGPGDWEWRDLCTSDVASAHIQAEEARIESSFEHEWDDHYRGIEYEFVDVPPHKIIVEKLSEARARLTAVNTTIEDLEKLL
jgi:hypothetical protein